MYEQIPSMNNFNKFLDQFLTSPNENDFKRTEEIKSTHTQIKTEKKFILKNLVENGKHINKLNILETPKSQALESLNNDDLYDPLIKTKKFSIINLEHLKDLNKISNKQKSPLVNMIKMRKTDKELKVKKNQSANINIHYLTNARTKDEGGIFGINFKKRR
jgi:hypothetical protein